MNFHRPEMFGKLLLKEGTLRAKKNIRPRNQLTWLAGKAAFLCLFNRRYILKCLFFHVHVPKMRFFNTVSPASTMTSCWESSR